MTQNMEALVEVTQADWDAAADWYGCHAPHTKAYTDMAHRFARHRLSADRIKRETVEACAVIAERAVTYVVGDDRRLADRIAAAIRALTTNPPSDQTDQGGER